MTLRETLETVERMTRRTPPELRSAPLPSECADVWRWFTRLNATRPQGLGAGGIPETEIRAFFQNRRITPMQWEIEALAALDAAAMKAE